MGQCQSNDVCKICKKKCNEEFITECCNKKCHKTCWINSIENDKCKFCNKEVRCEKCTICQNYIVNDVVKSCRFCEKEFHENCWDQWTNIHSSCPNCRRSSLPQCRQNTIIKLNE